MEKVELQNMHKDMQGLIARGYNELTSASYLLLEITDAALARKYLQYLLNNNFITPADKREIKPQQKEILKIASTNETENFSSKSNQSTGLRDSNNHNIGGTKEIHRPIEAMQIAFTVQGLIKLGLPTEIISTFSREFKEGMSYSYIRGGKTIEERSVFLGDVKDNHPDNWKWGNKKIPVDCVLMCYAISEQRLEDLINDIKSSLEVHGLKLILEQKTYKYLRGNRKNNKEHFGFRDGISQPLIEGFSKAEGKGMEDVIRTGEFVLGYLNEYNSYNESPNVSYGDDPTSILPLLSDDSEKKDFGKNGTYLVYRQMKQNIVSFWKYMLNNTKTNTGDYDIDEAIKLGAKMVGRWPGGAPLVLDPYFDNVNRSFENAFNYYQDDKYGFKCPFGAHIRRTNPRDQLNSGRDREKSIEMVRKHRILRRGRIYGEPIVANMEPHEILKKNYKGRIRRRRFR